jgi:hypothetical protein
MVDASKLTLANALPVIEYGSQGIMKTKYTLSSHIIFYTSSPARICPTIGK